MANTTKVSSSSAMTELPSLSQLFTDSWDRLKAVGWRLVALYVIMSVVVGGGFLVGLLIGGGALLGVSGLSNIESTLQNPATWVSFGALMLVLIIAVSFLASAFTGAIIMAVDEGEKRTPIGDLIKRGFGLVVPLFVVTLITQFLVMGGLFLLVIPGIVMAVLLSFGMYEVVLGNARGMAALKNSVSIVSQNFWGILGRLAALIGVQLVVTFILGSLSEGNSAASGLFGMLSSLVSMFFSLYSLVYGVLLYRAARAHTNLAEGKMTWMWPVAILGWVVGGAFLLFVARAATSAINAVKNNPEEIDRLLEEYGEYDSESADESLYLDPEMMLDSTQEGQQYAEMYEQLMQDGEISDEELNNLYQDALQLQQQATE